MNTQIKTGLAHWWEVARVYFIIAGVAVALSTIAILTANQFHADADSVYIKWPTIGVTLIIAWLIERRLKRQ